MARTLKKVCEVYDIDFWEGGDGSLTILKIDVEPVFLKRKQFTLMVA
jgi:hypothetical protein